MDKVCSRKDPDEEHEELRVTEMCLNNGTKDTVGHNWKDEHATKRSKWKWAGRVTFFNRGASIDTHVGLTI